VLAEKLMAADVRQIVKVVTDAALKGDLTAAGMVLARLYPPPKGRRLHFDMPVGLGLGGIAVAFDSLISAVASGAVTVDEAAGISAILERQAKILEASEMEKRIAALEKLAERGGTR
jgi:hypothetical protein